MIIENGTKVLIAHRRLFEQDHMRLFTGIVEGYELGIARVLGHTWVRDGYTGEYRRKKDSRTKIISLVSGTVIVYQLPSTVDLSALRVVTKNTNVYMQDGGDFEMDLTEGPLHATPLAQHRRPA